MTERLRLGDLLVEMNLITRAQLEAALSAQANDSRKVGEILVDQGAVSESQVTQVLSQQLSVPWVALQHIDFSRQLLNLVPRETAERFGVVPVYVRRARNRKETLYVAMKDPTDEAPLREIAEHTGLPVRPMIAPPTDIRAAIRAYYLGLAPEEEIETEPEPVVLKAAPPTRVSTPAAPPPPRVSGEPKPAPGAAAPSDAPDAPPRELAPPPASLIALPSDPDDDDGLPPSSRDGEPPESAPLGSRAPAMPQPDAAGAPRMVTLTLLDGVQITLPAASARRGRGRVASSPSSELTARDLIEALRARGLGADASEVLGEEVNWERMFAALLALLLKKHLVHDWEFVNELHRK
jgi:type IV pilus assembly protein PilB